MNKRRVHEFGSLVETSGGTPKLSILRHAIHAVNVGSGLLFDVEREAARIRDELIKEKCASRTIAHRNLYYKFLVSTHPHNTHGTICERL